MSKLRVAELFAGYGSQRMALDRLKRMHPEFDFEVVAISEIDKHAITAYEIAHGDCPNLGDVTKVDWDKAPDFDLLTYSFPCGLKGTLVKTDSNYSDISEVQPGDRVLTHNNRYRRVVNVMTRVAPSHFHIKATGCDLRLTEEHPLYVLRDGLEQWVKVKDLRLTDKVSYCIPKGDEGTSIDDKTLWLLGRYCADGWINPRHYNSVSFGIGEKKSDEFNSHIPDNMSGRFKVYAKSCLEYRIADANFQHLCRDFGIGATNKQIPDWLLALSSDKIKIFLDGYLAGDGHKRFRKGHEQQMFSTTSKKLFLGLQKLILKAYGIVCGLYIRKDKRRETFNDTYNGQYCEKTLWQEKIGERVYVPIKKIELIEGDVDVYNFEVEEDNSYTCDNVNVHNCTDISNAGLQKGFAEGSGTRSSLLWECAKAIEAKKPKYMLMENVKALVSGKFMPEFKRWTMWLSSLGYKNFYKVMDAKDYGVPQHRERVFMVSILRTGDDPNPQYAFPMPYPLERRLKHVLLPYGTVPEEYYLPQEKVDKILEHCNRKIAAGCGFTANCETDTYLKEPQVRQIGNGTENSKRNNPQTNRVYDTSGIAPTLNTCQGGNREPQILEPIACAMRGRNPNNPSDRTAGIPTEQRLELGGDIANCLTSVQKDSMVVVPEPIKVRQAQGEPPWLNEGRMCAYKEQSDGSIRGYNPNTADKRGISEEQYTGIDAIAPTVTTAHELKVIEPVQLTYRIRKLHPIETYRLMDVDEDCIARLMDAKNSKGKPRLSKTAHYKLAGNSIVVNCLALIFENLFCGTPCRNQQLTLF